MTELTRDTIIPFIGKIFAEGASGEYLGEPVSIGEHMLQGALLAEEAGAREEVIAAALLHDIGHFTHAFPT
ncbi:MAG: HD domain-containing protein, partial [Pseudomonadota bacterium]